MKGGHVATWRPGPEDLRRVFAEQNPWHRTGVVPDVLARSRERPLARGLPDRIVDPAAPRRFQLVLGPRRVGKTTAMYQAARRLLASGVPPGAGVVAPDGSSPAPPRVTR